MDYKEQGKKNRAAGLKFERKVRIDLEKKGWIVSKWFNNVEFAGHDFKEGKHQCLLCGKGRLITARHKFRGIGIPMAMGTGFPDFIAFKIYLEDGFSENAEPRVYMIVGVEAKSNGYLTKEEKEKCKWLINNHIFSKILIAKKGKKRGTVEYNEWKINV